jgi:predicted O-linked N-acetylglucosamine transferase (SPINDLY family)
MGRAEEDAEAERLFEESRRRLSEGARDEAEALLRAALELAPDCPRALNNLALLRAQAGDELEARSLLERAAAAGGSAKTWANLGRARRRAGELEAAIDALRRSLKLDPGSASTWLSLGDALEQVGRSDDALASLERAVEVDPGSAVAHNNLGLSLQRRGDDTRALERLAQAVALDPGSAPLAWNHGDALRRARRFGEARLALERAVALDAARSEPWQALAMLLHDLGEVRAATEAAHRAWELAPAAKRCECGSTYLFVASHDDAVAREALIAAHRRWGLEARSRALGTPGAAAIEARTTARRSRVGQPLRVGYLSADFCQHVVMRFFEPVLEAHDRSVIEPVLLSATSRSDATTTRLAAAYPWVELAGLALEEQRRRVADAECDAIVDLGGHTATGSLEILALRLAALQLTWLGYPGTTGLETIDLRITDQLVDPPGAERDYVERLARLGRTAWAYPAEHASIAPRPGSDAGLVMGSFNRLGKVSPATLSSWCEALERLPKSTLIVRASALDEPEVRARLEATFAARGLRGRVELRGWVESPEAALAEIAGVDVVLDTFPYHGTTTTCDALSVGTPVVSLLGETPAGRVSPSLLAEVGLGKLAVPTREAYLASLVELAGGVDELRRSRATRIDRYRRSALSDAVGLARAIERVIVGAVSERRMQAR